MLFSAVACLCATDLLAVQSCSVRALGLHAGKRGGWSRNSFSWAVRTVLRAAENLGYLLSCAFLPLRFWVNELFLEIRLLISAVQPFSIE